MTVNFPNTSRNGAEKLTGYATSDDFGKLFVEDMKSLYLLSYLLIANHETAKRCFVSGLEDCVQGNLVFQEWARSWSRRAIVRSAIRMMSPLAGFAAGSSSVVQPAAEGQPEGTLEEDIGFANVLSLDAFERFVFVLSVLERYPDHECAVLLGCSRNDVREGRTRAFQQLTDFAWRTAASKDDFSCAAMNWELTRNAREEEPVMAEVGTVGVCLPSHPERTHGRTDGQRSDALDD